MRDLLDNDKHILIFGGTGFLGKELLKNLYFDGYKNISIFVVIF